MDWRVIIGNDTVHRNKDGLVYETNSLHEAVDTMVRLSKNIDGKVDIRKVEYDGYISDN